VKTILKEKALILRQNGRSLGEIAKALNISKSTASLWTSDVKINEEGLERIQKQKKLSQDKGHQIQHEKKLMRLKAAEDEAQILLEKAKNDKNKELIALAIMYWCEGNKNDVKIGFTNSDPNLVRTFLVMLQSNFKIDKTRIKICLHLHDYHNEQEMLGFWSFATGIPLNQFNKTFKKPSLHKYSSKDYKGCAQITYGDSHVARVLLSFAKSFIKLYI